MNQLGLQGWMTIWTEDLCKEWGYERGAGFSKYVHYLTSPSHRKQPWMMDQAPTVWFSEGNEWTVDQLLAPMGMCPGKHVKPRRNGMTPAEMYDGTLSTNCSIKNCIPEDSIFD